MTTEAGETHSGRRRNGELHAADLLVLADIFAGVPRETIRARHGHTIGSLQHLVGLPQARAWLAARRAEADAELLGQLRSELVAAAGPALRALVEVACDPQQPGAARVAAAKVVLDRALPADPTRLEVAGPGGSPVVDRASLLAAARAMSAEDLGLPRPDPEAWREGGV